MAYSLNRAQIIGNVTRDPEVRMAGGQQVATFSVATNFAWTDSTGQKKEKAEFHNVVVWRKLAEIAQNYVKKGNKIYVEGKMQTREWEGEDGVKRYKTEIVADNIILLDKKGSDSTGYNRSATHINEDAGTNNHDEPMREEVQGSSSQSLRPQRSVKSGSNESPIEAHVPEVSIDDLPF